MPKTAYIHIKINPETKELFSRLCNEEGVDLSHAIRDLIEEAIARGYINKERKERIQQMRKVTTSDA
jgi:antitoxin component of RelBE/YafQ-DinJ toxin-antitoxin module